MDSPFSEEAARYGSGEQLPLGDLAARINFLGAPAAAVDRTVAAAVLLKQAQDRIERGEGDGITWDEWLKANVKLKKTRVRDLLKIAEADDKAKAVLNLREKTRKRTADCRANKCKDPAREALVKWVRDAPLATVKEALRRCKDLRAEAEKAADSGDTSASPKITPNLRREPAQMAA